jgi:hypothetical protein
MQIRGIASMNKIKTKYEYWEYCFDCGKPEKLDENYKDTHYKFCSFYKEEESK